MYQYSYLNNLTVSLGPIMDSILIDWSLQVSLPRRNSAMCGHMGSQYPLANLGEHQGAFQICRPVELRVSIHNCLFIW